MCETDDPIVRRIEGDNEAGLAHRLTQQWENGRHQPPSMTLCVLGSKFVGYVRFRRCQRRQPGCANLADLGTNPPPAK